MAVSFKGAHFPRRSLFGGIGGLKHFVRRPAGPAAPRAGAYGLDRHRCGGGRFPRGFYTHFQGDSTRSTG